MLPGGHAGWPHAGRLSAGGAASPSTFRLDHLVKPRNIVKRSQRFNYCAFHNVKSVIGEKVGKKLSAVLPLKMYGQAVELQMYSTVIKVFRSFCFCSQNF